MQLRVRALETVLAEKGYIDPAALDLIIEAYETKVGPHNGARVVAKAWSDPSFKRALIEDATEDLTAARRPLAAGAELGEREYLRLESAGNRLAELQRGIDEGADVRVVEGLAVPGRSASRPLVRSMLPDAHLRAALAAATAAEASYVRALRQAYGYDLVRRNCVSELFRTIDTALAPRAGERAGATPVRGLGGHVSADGPLAIVPFVSALAVRRAYAVATTDEIPSYRHMREDTLAARQGRLGVWLRESNTVTSTIYRRSVDDSLFLFFTDEAVAPRPLLGVANLAVALGGSIAGLAVLPVDRGAALGAALRGLVYSVPELAFVNVRKGTFDHVDRRSWATGS